MEPTLSQNARKTYRRIAREKGKVKNALRKGGTTFLVQYKVTEFMKLL